MHAWMVCLMLAASSAEARDEVDHHPIEASMSDAVSFDEALGLVREHPYPKALREAAEEKQRRDRKIRGLTQGPQVTVMPGARVHPEPNRGFEFQGGIVQPWSLEGYGHKRIASAKAETEVLGVQARAAALESQLGAARAWIALWNAERQLELARAQREIRRTWWMRVREALEAGVATASDVTQAQVGLALLETQTVEAEGAVHDLGLDLAAETGRGGALLQTEGDPPSLRLPPVSTLSARFAAVDQLPSLTVHRLQARWHRALAVEAKAGAGTTMSAGVAMQREGTRDIVVFGSLGLNLPWNHGSGEVASQLAQARVSEGEEAGNRQRLAAHLAVVVHELEHARRRVEVLRDQVLPAANGLIEAREAALGFGETTWVLLLNAQDQHAAIRGQLQDAEAAWLWAQVEAWLYLEAIERGEERRP